MELKLYREFESGLQLLGSLADDGSFAYDESYLASPNAAAISFSLPLKAEPFSPEAAKPYFAGLLPEGGALALLAGDLGVREDDYLTLLANCGLDCVGDIIINPEAYSETPSYKPVDIAQLFNANTPSQITNESVVSRLSLAGTQNKIGLFCSENSVEETEWFKPKGSAPSNVIVKFPNENLPRLMLIEQISMMCAQACGLNVAKSALLPLRTPAISVRRFDRVDLSCRKISGLSAPLRRHQEDFTQVFGINSGSKYAEIQGGSYSAISEFLDKYSFAPALDKMELLKVAIFDYAIGNCDNHLKNLSILYSSNWKTVRLAPAYDLVSTTYFERFSRTMGMAIGSSREIDEINEFDLRALAKAFGLRESAVASTCRKIANSIVPALRGAGAKLEKEGFIEAPYVADEIEEEIAPRIEILKAV